MKRRTTRPSGRPSGFTFIETLVVVGIVAVLAVGVAVIFDSIGETITRGKRVSDLNRTAAQIERVMRSDFDRMTRDGFLVIFNEYANRGTAVNLFDPALYEGEPNQRPRRVDQLMFFASSTAEPFQTSRRAAHPDLIVQASEAQIYYGHGLKAIRPTVPPANPNTDEYFRPQVLDANHDTQGNNDFGRTHAQAPVRRNPNEFASDWSLLRRVTLLVPPSSLETSVPNDLLDPAFGFTRQELVDKRRQVGLQPAVRSVFRGVADQRPAPMTIDEAQTFRHERVFIPRLASGLVDIAVTDLAEIRAAVNHMTIRPNQFGGWASSPPFDQVLDARAESTRELMQEWMIDAMPGNVQWYAPNRTRTRIRYESEPTLATITDAALVGGGSTERREFERAYREADQEMLTSAIFAARCTEFIVEWSYGQVDRTAGSPTFGQYIWYGLPRYEDRNGNGAFNAGTDVIVAEPFQSERPIFARDVLPALTGQPASSFGSELLYPPRALINADLPVIPFSAAPSAQPEVSLFGYFDPRTADNPSDDVPWLWPEFIRVTITVADENDPTIEQTYQAEFSVPGGGLTNR